jgi:hypothetical protein
MNKDRLQRLGVRFGTYGFLVCFLGLTVNYFYNRSSYSRIEPGLNLYESQIEQADANNDGVLSPLERKTLESHFISCAIDDPNLTLSDVETSWFKSGFGSWEYINRQNCIYKKLK